MTLLKKSSVHVFSFAGDKEKDSEKQKNAKDGLGSVHNLPHYMKIYETLKGAYSNYMVHTCNKFQHEIICMPFFWTICNVAT